MIKLQNIDKAYEGVPLFQNFTLEFAPHQVHSIVGPSGVGKTTLINLLAGLALPDRGEVLLPENSVKSYVFQEPRLLPWYDAYSNIDFVLKELYSKEERSQIIDKYLSLVGLSQYAHSPLSSLSGGMVQRVALCRAFAYPSDLLFLDEPFKGLDTKLKDELLDAFCRIYEEDERTVFFVTHDLDDALRLSDSIYLLKNRPAKLAGRFDRETGLPFPADTRDRLLALL